MENLEVTLKSLELSAMVEPDHDTPGDEILTPLSETTDATENPTVASYSAIMTFTVKSLGGASRELAFNILYDVHFVTAHPCVPSRHTMILNSPTSPSFRIPELASQAVDLELGPHELHFGRFI